MTVSQSSDDKTPEESNRHYGTVVRVDGDVLVTRSDAGLEHSHRVAIACKLTRRGKPCHLSEFVPGTRVRLSVQPGDDHAVIHIACLRSPGSS